MALITMVIVIVMLIVICMVIIMCMDIVIVRVVVINIHVYNYLNLSNAASFVLADVRSVENQRKFHIYIYTYIYIYI